MDASLRTWRWTTEAALAGEVDGDASNQGKQNLDEVQVASAATNAAISVLVVSADLSEGTVNNGDSSLRNRSATTQRGRGRGRGRGQVHAQLVTVSSGRAHSRGQSRVCSGTVSAPGNLSASASTNTGWNKLDT